MSSMFSRRMAALRGHENLREIATVELGRRLETKIIS